MAPSLRLRGVQVLEAPDRPARTADVGIGADGTLLWIDSPSAGREPEGAVRDLELPGCWFGPALVDPHSQLEEPLLGRAETLASLGEAAAAGGYGTVALLPWARDWRDRAERLDLRWPDPLRLLLWGSFSQGGEDHELAPHGDQLAAGAIGLAGGDELPPLALLERGLRIAEMGARPVLLAPRDSSLTAQGFVRERVEALRAGWPPDPVLSEILPLQTLLTLAAAQPEARLCLMNLSTAEGVSLLRSHPAPPPASVCWWHLVADSGSLHPADEGWRLVPSLGGPGDREALIGALADGVITAVAVHHQPLDAEERLLPLDQRRPGIAGHGVALPFLWQELVQRRGWSPERLWQVLCWGPARFLGLEPEGLAVGSRRWLLFDPSRSGEGNPSGGGSLAANQPSRHGSLRGRVVACGLSDRRNWLLPDCRSC